MTTLIVEADGVASVEELADVQSRVTVEKFFWVDLVGEDEMTRAACLRMLAIEDADINWCGRFGQSGRMNIRPQRLRASTWIDDENGKLIEIHVIGGARGLATVWTGEAALLDRARQQFADRIGGFDGKFFLAVGILMQLLLGTLDAAILSLDARIDLLRATLDRPGKSVDFATESRRQPTIQTLAANFSRYSSTVRAAMVGVEALPGIGEHGAKELNDYVEQVRGAGLRTAAVDVRHHPRILHNDRPAPERANHPSHSRIHDLPPGDGTDRLFRHEFRIDDRRDCGPRSLLCARRATADRKRRGKRRLARAARASQPRVPPLTRCSGPERDCASEGLDFEEREACRAARVRTPAAFCGRTKAQFRPVPCCC